jgi:hypothetical protein
MLSEERNAGSAISRMPKAVRDQVSRALEDGADWKEVRAICAKAGHPGVRAQNVTNYRKGAHKEWIAKEERIESLRRNSEQTREAIRFYAEHGGNPAEAGLLAAAEMMHKVIEDMGVESFQVMAADNPETVFKMLKELRGFATIMSKHSSAAAATTANAGQDSETPALSEEEQNAKVVAMVDAALGLKSK